MQPRSLKAPTQEKAPLRARDRPLEKVQMLHKQTGMRVCTNIQQRFFLTPTSNLNHHLRLVSPSVFPLSVCLALYPFNLAHTIAIDAAFS